MFKLAAVFGDHMVLARRKEIRVFGIGDEGTELTASLGDHKTRAKVINGRFTLLLPPMEACAGLALAVSDGHESVIFNDVAIGDVYLAGGQSNMERELIGEADAESIISAHDDPYLRFYNVPKTATIEATLAAEPSTRWVCASPGALSDVSAVAYFFALRLRRRLQIPIGIIDCYWGGTLASCWMDKATLSRVAAGQEELRDYDEHMRGKTLAQHTAEMNDYNERQARWCRIAERIRATEPFAPYERLVEEAGDNPWPPPMGPLSFLRPTGLYGTMLERVVPYALTGFLYYQGESDCGHADRYFELLCSLVVRWRELFMDESLPFLNVQLPVYDDQTPNSWADIRLAQARARDELANTGLASLLDLGDAQEIHPQAKEPVGDRLYEQALRVVYGLDGRESPRALMKYALQGVMRVRLSAPLAPFTDDLGLFELAGEDGVYYIAKAEYEHGELCITCPDVPNPVRVRYAYRNYMPCVLMGQNGLPLEPFSLA